MSKSNLQIVFCRIKTTNVLAVGKGFVIAVICSILESLESAGTFFFCIRPHSD